MAFLYPWEDIDLLKALTCLNKGGNTLLLPDEIGRKRQR
jgi:hypothetical protein